MQNGGLADLVTITVRLGEETEHQDMLSFSITHTAKCSSALMCAEYR